MATPITRKEFKEYCLRKLGKPVIEINVDDDQIDDRIDEAIKYYWDYHFDGSEKLYYKYMMQDHDRRDCIKEINVVSGGTGYSNTDTVVITNDSSDVYGKDAAASIVTSDSGVIIEVIMTEHGNMYTMDPSISVTSMTGSGAVLRGYKGGYIKLSENVMGVVGIFPIGDPSMSINDIFNIRYQIALNDLYTLTSVQLTPYYMAMEHLALIQQLLVGQQPVRFNRHTDKIYIDTDWAKLPTGRYILIECYRVIDPEEYTDAWGDRWLARYATALIKRQWGTNLTKFTGMTLPGGVQFNGTKIYDDAENEIAKLEQEMISSYSLPVMDMYG